MLKNILKLEGVQKLNKIEQKSISGGYGPCPPDQVLNTGGGCANKVPD